MLVRSKLFSQFVKKIEKLELSLSKQQNKMLKIRSEMMKIIKNVKMMPKKLSGNFPNPEDFQDPGNFPVFLENF